MKLQELKTYWKSEEEKTFTGWDFSYLDDRSEEEKLPWDYKALVLKHLKVDQKMLDMGTGGGEFLLSLGHPYGLTAVTEAYPPNVELCKAKLGALGIEVQQVFDDHVLPFLNEQFDLIINRHEAYDVAEVHRILKPGGRFITQQVGPLNNYEFSKVLLQDFDRLPSATNGLQIELEEALRLGFEVERQEEYFPYLRFSDVGALVYFAKIIEWEFPGFTVERSFNQLVALHRKLEVEPFIESQEHRYLMILRKP